MASSTLDKLYEKLLAKARGQISNGGVPGAGGGASGLTSGNKRFRDENDLLNWIGGVGHGFEEHFRRGAWYDDDATIRMLSRVARTRAYGKGQVGWNPGKYVFGDESYDSNSFMPQQGESYEDWVSRSELSGALDEKDLRELYDSTGSNAQDTPQAKEAAALETSKKSILDKMTAFADEMNMPVDQLLQKDEFAKRLRGITFGESMTQSSNRGFGVEGGLSAANADQATKNALLNYQGQRQQAGQAAYGNIYNFLNQQGLQAEDARRYEQGLDLQLQGARQSAYDQRYQQGMNQQQNMFGIAGGIIGGIYGGPGGRAAGYAAGSQLGSSIGGAAYQNSNPYKPYNYSYPSGSRGGGAGSTRYGGNY